MYAYTYQAKVGQFYAYVFKENGLRALAIIGRSYGAAFETKYEREVPKNDKAVAFFGDVTCNNGQFFEYWKLPIIFCC